VCILRNINAYRIESRNNTRPRRCDDIEEIFCRNAHAQGSFHAIMLGGDRERCRLGRYPIRSSQTSFRVASSIVLHIDCRHAECPGRTVEPFIVQRDETDRCPRLPPVRLQPFEDLLPCGTPMPGSSDRGRTAGSRLSHPFLLIVHEKHVVCEDSGQTRPGPGAGFLLVAPMWPL